MFKWLGIDSNEKVVNRMQPTVDKINALSPGYRALSDDQLRAKTAEFKSRIAEAAADKKHRLEDTRKELDEARGQSRTAATGYEKESVDFRIKELEKDITRLDAEVRKAEIEFLDKLLPEAFAAVREAARRTIKQVHFDVQLIGGIVLHQGKIAEMRTGEGKTLTATLPLYLNALTGQGLPPGDRKRLSGPPRPQLDGTGISRSGNERCLYYQPDTGQSHALVYIRPGLRCRRKQTGVASAAQ